MNLTKRKALEICKELWTWMRDEKKESDLDKSDWPKWDVYGDMENDCPICEYKSDIGKNCTDGCLLIPFAWKSHCNLKRTPYNKFVRDNGTPEDAQKIIDACDKALEDLK